MRLASLQVLAGNGLLKRYVVLAGNGLRKRVVVLTYYGTAPQTTTAPPPSHPHNLSLPALSGSVCEADSCKNKKPEFIGF